jgi:hypothetical protein
MNLFILFFCNSIYVTLRGLPSLHKTHTHPHTSTHTHTHTTHTQSYDTLQKDGVEIVAAELASADVKALLVRHEKSQI